MPTEPTYYGEMRGHMTQETPTDALVKRSQSGDREAFEQLVDRYRSRLEKQVEARMGQGVKYKLDAADIVQETLIGALKSIGKFQYRGGDSFYRWLGSIAEHLIWNAAQKKDWNRLEAGHDLAENGVPPSKNLRRDERFDRLESALSGLSPDHRRAIILSRIEGLKVREIASRMNRSTDAVKKLLARGLVQLKRSFGDTESFHLPDRAFNVEGVEDDE